GLEVRGLVEEAADLGRGEPFVDDAAERRELLGAPRRAARRHHRLLVPTEDRACSGEVADLGEAAAQLLEGRGHGEEPYSTPCLIWLANSLAQLSGVVRYSAGAGPCSSGDGFRPRPSPT